MISSDQPGIYFFGAAFLAWNIILSILFWRIIGHYQRLVKKTKKGNLQTVLDDLFKQSEENGLKIKTLEDQIKKIDKKMEKDYQRSAIVKYNPFSDTGGNQSFSLVILNGDKDGLMITSLHGRDSTRIYAKKIVDGKSESGDLSKEEQLAIKNALGGNK